jgi:hypothetical protein
MAYWNGTSWVPETAAGPPARRTHRRRLLGATTEASLIVLLAFGLIAGTTFAAKGGNGKGPAPKEPAGSCQVDGNVVHGWNLPVWELMNFMVTDASGTSGWVIGYTDTGDRSITVPAQTGPTTYQFTGRTSGADGTKYDVYATCSTT